MIRFLPRNLGSTLVFVAAVMTGHSNQPSTVSSLSLRSSRADPWRDAAVVRTTRSRVRSHNPRKCAQSHRRQVDASIMDQGGFDYAANAWGLVPQPNGISSSSERRPAVCNETCGIVFRPLAERLAVLWCERARVLVPGRPEGFHLRSVHQGCCVGPR